MNYQNVLCLGDSQSFGARSYGCYPLYLAKILTERTGYTWRAINRSSNGHKARDLWFRLGQDLEIIGDTFQACLLIGSNDVGEATPVELFSEYYRQSLSALFIKNYKAVLCGEIPPIHADGHVFFSKDRASRRAAYNEAIQALTAEYDRAHWVPMGDLPRDCYEDPVHFNEAGNLWVAERFAEAMLQL
jgi:lysophospholipase L1-like esterase